MPKNGLRQRKKELVQQALYDAAMELFREKGFKETSVDEIAERAGYSRATFFNHFGTKQRVLRLYGQRILGLVERHLGAESAATPPLERIRRIIMLMVREAEERTEEIRIVCTNSILDPEYVAGPSPARRRLFEILAELVAEAQEKGQIRRDISARDLTTHIFMLYQGVVYAVVIGADNRESLLDSAWQFILKGVDHDDAAR